MLRLALAAALALLPLTPSQGALLVQQWVNFGHGDNPGNAGLAGVDAAIASRAPDISTVHSIIDFTDDPAGFAGDLPGSFPWPLAAAHGAGGDTGSEWNTNFAARVTTNLTITADDIYYFRTFADDGVRLRIGSSTVIEDNSYHPEIPLIGGIHLTPGTYPLELVFFEGGGEASLEFSVAQGAPENFGHVGALGGPGTGTPTVPDGGATTIALLGLGLLSLGLFRGRAKRPGTQTLS